MTSRPAARIWPVFRAVMSASCLITPVKFSMLWSSKTGKSSLIIKKDSVLKIEGIYSYSFLCSWHDKDVYPIWSYLNTASFLRGFNTFDYTYLVIKMDQTKCKFRSHINILIFIFNEYTHPFLVIHKNVLAHNNLLQNSKAQVS